MTGGLWIDSWAPGRFTSKWGEDQHEFTQIQTCQAWVDFLSFAVNSFDDVPSELSGAVHSFDDIRRILTSWHHHNSAFLWNLRLVLRIIWKILFVCFGGFTKNYWPNISLLDEVNDYISCLFFLEKCLISKLRIDARNWFLFFTEVFWGPSSETVAIDVRGIDSRLRLLQDLSL